MEKSGKRKSKPDQANRKPRSNRPAPRGLDQEKLRLVKELEASEIKFRRLFETAQDGILLLDAASGVITEVNPYIEKLLGYTRMELIGKKLWEIGLFADIPASQEAFQLLQRKKTIRYDDLPLKTKSGRSCQVEFVSNVYRVGSQKVIQCNIHDITDRVQVDKVLLETKDYWQSLVENTSDLITMIDSHGTILYQNHAAERMLGYPVEETIGKNAARFVQADDWAKAWKVFETSAELLGSKYPILELRIRHKDGTWRIMETTGEARTDEDGKLVAVLSSRDITERKRSEAEKGAERNLLRTLIDNLPDAIYVKDHKSRFVLGNTAVARVMGAASTDELIGKTDYDYYPEPLARQYLADDRKVIRSDKPVVNREEQIIYPDGSQGWVLTTKVPLRGQNGLPGGLVGIGRTITERKQADIERQTLLEIMQGNTLTYDIQEYLHFVHQAIARVIVADNFFVILKNKNTGLFEEIYSVDKYDPPAAPSMLENSISAYVFRSGKPLLLTRARFDDLVARGEIDKVGAKPLSWLGVPLITSKETIGVMVVQEYDRKDRYSEHDKDFLASIAGQVAQILERKQSEEEIRQLNADLEARVEARTRELQEAQERLVRQEKLAVLGQLAGSVGHELRNPLGIINNAAYYLRMIQPQADEKVREYLGIIEHETHTADKIITDLLEFSRTKSVEKEPVKVVELVQRVLVRYPPPENVEVIQKLPENLPRVEVDPQHLAQVLGNLVVNACQAMASHSTSAARPGRLTIRAARKGKEVAIAVQDSGVGIPPENMKKLFEPLFTTKPKGIGLGLAVSQRLMEANGGRIEVQSEPGQGSTFTVFLPVYRDSA